MRRTPRERVLKVLRGEVPDSVPRGLYDVAIDNYNATTVEFFLPDIPWENIVAFFDAADRYGDYGSHHRDSSAAFVS